jgi:N-methylhydantoinase B/oxoprolinase/acetone carboxylase alpha subunit
MIGILRLSELFEQIGPEVVLKDIDELVDYTEGRTPAELAKLPRGTCPSPGSDRDHR